MKYAKVLLIAALAGCAPATIGQSARAAAPAGEARLSYAQLLLAAQKSLEGGHADAAIALASDACRIDDARAEAYVIRGRALAHIDRVGESSRDLERARARGARHKALFQALASNYDVEHRYAEAIAVYCDYLGECPHDAVMRDELAVTYLLVGQPEKAVAQLRLARQDEPDNQQIREDLGHALLAAKQFAQAERELEQVSRLPDTPPQVHRLWAQALMGQKKFAAAQAVVAALLEHYPLDRNAQALQRQLVDLGAAQAAHDGPVAAEASNTQDATPP